MNIYNVGASRRPKATFTDIDGSLADPSTVVFKAIKPDETLVTYTYGVDPEVVRESLGVFYLDYLLDQKGLHVVNFIGSGTIQAVGVYACWAKRTIS